MAAPLEPTPPAAPTLGMGAGFSKGPDGQYWVSVTVMSGPTSYTFGIPLDSADEAADGIANLIKATAKDARRARSGLTVIEGGSGNALGDAQRSYVAANRSDRRR